MHSGIQSLLTAMFALSTAAQPLQNGTYWIWNRVVDGSGNPLFITYQGAGQYVTAEPLAGLTQFVS